MTTAQFAEQLESRTLFSVSPTVQADLDAIAAHQQQLATHRADGLALIAADRQAVVADLVTARRGDPTLIQKLRDDVAAFADQFRQARVDLATTLAQDRSRVLADALQLRAHRGNLTLLLADRMQLLSDFSQIRSHLQAFVAQIATGRADRQATIFNDLSAIAASRISPTLVADRQKLADDTHAYQQTLSDDLAQLRDDRVTLIDDIRAHA